MKEEWKHIPSFPSYEASNMGNIRSFKGKNKAPRILTGGINKKTGYLFVTLSKDRDPETIIEPGKKLPSKDFKYPVHYFVARAWLPSPPDDGRKWEVNHKNLDKLDNRVKNLEFVTRMQNASHAAVNGAYANHTNQHWRKGRHYLRKLTRDQVKMIRVLRDADFSLIKIAQTIGCDHKTVDRILKKEIYADWCDW